MSLNHITYSVQDMNTVMKHPAMGAFQFNGEGIDAITFGRANDMSSHDSTSDGTVITNKMIVKNGMVTIVVAQNSDADKYISKIVNYMENAPVGEFTRLNITSSSKHMGKSHTATGCSPQKMSDKVYGGQAGKHTYVFLAQTIEEGVA